MEQTGNQKYTLGFIFDTELKNVLLVHKQKPEWQRGKVNGVGGKYEPGETAQACISRETFEETKLNVPAESWAYIGTIHQEAGDVGVLAVRYGGNMNDAMKNDHEDIQWFVVDALPDTAMSNLRWLVPLSLEKLQNKFKTFDVQY